MAFVAPIAGEVAAGAAASSAGAAGGAAAAGKAAKATKAGGAKAASSAKAGAPARARELLTQGKGRDDAARVLRDEYGATLAEARGLVDDAAPADDTGDGGDGARRSSSSSRGLPRAPRVVVKATDSGAGIVLGLLSYALVTTYLRGGPVGVKKWLAAKFLNRVDGAA